MIALTSKSSAAKRDHSIHLTQALHLKDLKMKRGVEFSLPLTFILSADFTRILFGCEHKYSIAFHLCKFGMNEGGHHVEPWRQSNTQVLLSGHSLFPNITLQF